MSVKKMTGEIRQGREAKERDREMSLIIILLLLLGGGGFLAAVAAVIWLIGKRSSK
jgi:hypothetical protein